MSDMKKFGFMAGKLVGKGINAVKSAPVIAKQAIKDLEDGYNSAMKESPKKEEGNSNLNPRTVQE